MKPSVKQRFLERLRCAPDAPALWVNDQLYSYRYLYDQAMKLSRAAAGSRSPFWIIVAEKNVHRYVAILAAVLSERAFVPVSPDSPERTFDSIFGQLSSDCYLVDVSSESTRQLLAEKTTAAPWVLDLSQPAHWPKASDVDDQPVTTDTAYVMFTSGSTGVPKGVAVTADNLAHYVHNTIDLFQPGPEDRFAQINSYTFDLSMHDVFVAWCVGACVYAFPTHLPFRYVQFVKQHAITFWLSVPSTGISLNEMGLLKPGEMPSMKCTLFCGEALPHRLVKAWQQATPNGEVYNIYGPTECTIAITHFHCQRGAQLPDIVPIGAPYPGQQMIQVNEQLHTTAPEVMGELLISGSQVAKGYHQNLEKTNQQFVSLEAEPGRWYRTGDWVTWSETHGYEYKGRVDDQLKIRGYRIERLEIEKLLREAAQTDAVAVVGWPVTETGLCQGVVAFIDNSPLTLPEIRHNYQQTMPEYMWPSQIHQQPLPKNTSLKVDYKQLKNQLVNVA